MTTGWPGFAELTLEAKGAVSHRGVTLARARLVLRGWLEAPALP